MKHHTIPLGSRKASWLGLSLLVIVGISSLSLGQNDKSPIIVTPGLPAAVPESPAPAQTGKVPSVTVAPVALVTAPRTEQTLVDVNFRVPRGYHINSNTPKSEFLIPTALKMDLGSATDIVLGKIDYPKGEDLSFPFSPDEKLNVYTGDFTITLTVHPLKAVVPGKYALHGTLRYQACDNSACYPPKTLPLTLDLKVVKEKAVPHKNPAQSPHIHS
jgi:hypothetical protein